VNTTPHALRLKPHTSQTPKQNQKKAFHRENKLFIENSVKIKEIYCNIVNNRITILTIPHLLTYFIAFMTKSITQKTTTKQAHNLNNYLLSCKNQTKYLTCLLILLFSSMGWGQVTVTNPTNTTPAMSATYTSLALAITDVNNRTAISGPVTITLTAAQTAPAGGYSITNTAITGGSNTNRFIFDGGSNIITAPTPQTSGNLNDALFKIIGADFITIQNFTMQENAANTTTTAASNNMTEFGVALFYATTANGAQNNIIQNNTITLNRTYQNTFGIYANATHTATVVTTSASATGTGGGNSGLKIYSNTISNVNNGILIFGPTAAADFNTGIDIGGSSSATANTINNFGTTGTFSAYANVSGSVYGIFIRNSIGFNVSYNSITSSNGGVTAGTLRGIFNMSASNTPTGTFTNNINNNTIALTYGVSSGTLQGITVEATNATTTSVGNINNNNFTSLTASVTTSATITAISSVAPHLSLNISGNTFTNLSTNTTGSFTFIGHSYTMPANGTQTLNNNSIVTAFNKTGAGGTVTVATSGLSSPNGTTHTFTNNTFSNITVTGATAITGVSNSDGASSSATRTVTGNTFNNWTGGTGAITGFSYSYIGGATSSFSTNTLTNITGQGAITGINLGSTANLATTVNVASNTINNLSSTGTGDQVLAISCSNTSTTININGNTINTLSSTAASKAVGAITVFGATTTNVYQNVIYDISTSGATAPVALGIQVAGGTLVNVYRNKIYNLSASGGTLTSLASAVSGIYLNGGTTVNTYNNLIGNLSAPNINLADAIRGINIISTTASSSYNVYNNSVYLTGGSAGANFGTSGIYHAASATATTAALDLQNNMIFNTCTPSGTGIVSAFRRSAAGTLGNYKSTSNKNLFYAGTPSATTTIMSDGTNNYQTLATFQTAVSTRDANSFTESAFTPSTYFVSTTGSNANYLQPASGITTQAEGGGNTITMCSPDFNGVTRPGFSGAAYDVGAWEFAGVSPAPVLTNMTPSPALTTQCTKAARAISIDITPASGTITGAILNYNHNGTAQTAVTMTNSSGNTWTGTMLAPSTGNATVTWSITATNSSGFSTLYSGTSYADEPTTGITATATATPSSVCDGSNASLSVSLVKSGTGVIGSGVVSSLSSPTPFSGSYGGMKGQYIILASELISAGYSAGNITGLGINFASSVTATYTGLTIQIGNTSLNAFNSTLNLESGLTTVYGPTSLVNPVEGVNAFTLTTPFNWNGVSNIIISTSWSNNTTTSTSASVITTTTTSNLAQVHKRDSYLPASLLALTGAQSGGVSTVGTARPNFTIIGNQPPTPSAYSWSNGSTEVGTTNPLSTPITSGLTYTATATVNGCPMTAAVTPTVNPLPTAPTATPSSQCGAGIPTASVSDNNGYTTPTFKWYSAATGGTLLQNSTSVTYTTSISATTTFYVAVVGTNTCESARTAVTVTVTQPDAISAVTSVPAICLGQSVTLTAANTATTPTQTYSYSWACATTGSGATSANTNNPASVTPTAAGSYTYTVTATDGGCSAVNTVVVTVNALPNITSATATPSAVCSGGNISLEGLNATSSTFNSGRTAPVGTSTYNDGTTGIVFEATSAFTLNSVNVYNNGGAGTLVIKLLNSSGTVLQTSSSFSVPAASGTTVFTANLGWSIPIGTGYRLVATTVSGISLVRESGLSGFPYALGSVGNITSGWFNAISTSYYHFYNWNITAQINQSNLYSWSWNSTPVIATATGSTTETNTTSSALPKTYTVTATNATTGCTNTATTSAVTINPATVAPTATNSSQCGTATPTCSVTGTGTSGNTFKWYLTATGGTALVGQTASTLSSYPVSATTSFYVSEFNGTCESARVQVTVTVTSAPTITAAASVNPVCSGSATVLSVTSSNSDYTYTWSNSAGTGASVSVNPTSATNYTVTATDASGGVNNGCSTTALVAITTNAVPSAITLTPASASICFGSTQSIVASGGSGATTNSTATNSTGTISLAIPDYNATGVTSSLNISSIPSTATITQVDVTFSLTHDWMSDAEITLTAPNGKVIALAADQGSSYSGLYNNVVITSDNTAAALLTTSATITGTYKANATPAAELFGSFGSNLTQTFSDLFSTPNGNWILSAFDDGSGDLGTLDSWSIVVTYSQPQFSWSPTATLFTDAAATTAYAGSPTTVYAKPTVNTTYTATATNAAGCSTSSTVLVSIITDKTWLGTTNNSWNTGTNWSCGTVPSSSDVVVINSGSPVLDTNFNVGASGSLTLSGSGTLTIAPGKVLTIAGTANFNGKAVTFKSDATGTAMLGPLTGSLTNATNVKVERFIPSGKRAFRLLSPAVTTSTFISGNWQQQTHITGGLGTTGLGFDATETNNPSMFTYNNQVASGTGWTPIANTNATNLTAGVGYRMLVRGDRNVNLTVASQDNMNAAITLSATGTLRTGTVTLDGSSTPAINNQPNTATTAGYSLVGNPYQSAVDWHLVTRTGIEDTYYAWAPNMGTGAARGNYVAYNVSTGNSGGGSVGQFIQPGQAFFVKNTVSGTAGTLTFQEAHKASTNANVFRTNNQTESTNFATLSTALYDPNELAIGGYPIDAMKAVFSSAYTNELGLGDATKLEAAGENIAWFRNNTKLAIDAAAPVTTSDELVMKTLRLGANKNYTFKIQTTNFDTALTPYLVDTFLNTQTEIATSQAYLATFATTSNVASYNENRFKIVFQNAVLSTDTFATQVGLYPNPSKGNGFYLQLPSTAHATVRLYNTLGQEIAISHNEGHYQANQSLAAGVYHIMVTQGEKTSKLKWIVE